MCTKYSTYRRMWQASVTNLCTFAKLCVKWSCYPVYYLIYSLNKSNTHHVNCVVWAVVNFHNCMLLSDQNIIRFHYYRSVWWCVISAAWEVFRWLKRWSCWTHFGQNQLWMSCHFTGQTDWEMDLTSIATSNGKLFVQQNFALKIWIHSAGRLICINFIYSDTQIAYFSATVLDFQS